MDTQSTEKHGIKALQATIAVIFGFGASQVIRLLGNLVLTRLLMPELFGIVAIARMFTLIIWWFSDIGTWPAVIRSERINEPSFINTAWTLDLIRGFVLTIICVLIAFPVSLFYEEPVLFPVLIFCGIMNIPSALQSTSLILLQKNLMQKKLITIDFCSQVFSLAVTLLLAFLYRNLWALLIGELAGTIFRTVWSHLINRRTPNRFALDRSAAKEILHFGKWILLSTAVMALATQVDRLILGKLFPLAWLGVYGIALTFADLPKQVINRLSDKVLYPFLTQFSGMPREEFRARIKPPRAKLLPILAIAFGVFLCFSDYIIRILYDERYSEAAWILPILSIGMWPLILVESIDSALLSIGQSRYFAFSNTAKLIYMAVAVPTGYFLAGSLGAVIAVALHDVPSYFVIGHGLKREGLSLFKQEAASTLLFIAVILLCILARLGLGMGLPGEVEFLAAHR